MRAPLHWIILAGAAIAMIAPATAQTYSSGAPVCRQIWEWGGSTRFDCSFSSWEQCERAMPGHGSMCVPNPYASQAQARYARPYGARTSRSQAVR